MSSQPRFTNRPIVQTIAREIRALQFGIQLEKCAIAGARHERLVKHEQRELSHRLIAS